MRGFVLFLLCFLCITAEDDYSDIYEDKEKWSDLMNVLDANTPQPGDVIYNVNEGDNPFNCRIGYVSEFPFDCPTFASVKAPASVHELTPADISVIGALGDSLTAAYGIESCTMSNLPIEYRGRSWSVGGDENVNTILTLANLIKAYNPDLKGYSEGIGNGPDSEAAKFNVAFSGARAEHMPGQAWDLVNRIKADPEVDFENDWKLVTMFIGTNDLCQYCLNENKYSTEQYIDYVRQALDILHEDLPKTFVNVPGIVRIPELNYYSNPKCDLIHLQFCPCAAMKQGDKHQEVWGWTIAYQEHMEALITSGRYDTKDDFTVVYQPFLVETHMPFLDNGEADASYFAPDCFHYSSRAHAVWGKDLWKNMFQPVGQKDTSCNAKESIYCPSKESPYFYTNVNSPESGSPFFAASTLTMLIGVLVSAMMNNTFDIM